MSLSEMVEALPFCDHWVGIRELVIRRFVAVGSGITAPA
jgi:hypothetical protein